VRATPAVQPAELGATDEKEVLAMERSFEVAHLQRDTPTLSALLSDDFEGIGPGGAKLTKATAIGALTAQMPGVQLAPHTDVNARSHGSMVVATGKAPAIRAGVTQQFSFVDIWVKRDNRWQLAFLNLMAPSAIDR